MVVKGGVDVGSPLGFHIHYQHDSGVNFKQNGTFVASFSASTGEFFAVALLGAGLPLFSGAGAGAGELAGF